MSTVSEIIIQNLHNYGFVQYLLPFILFLAITFGIMENAQILSKRRNVQFVVAFCVSSLAILSPMGPSMANFISIYSANASNMLIILLFTLIPIAFAVKVRNEIYGKEKDATGNWVFWIATSAVVITFVTSGGLDILSKALGTSSFILTPEMVEIMTIGGTFVFGLGFLYYLVAEKEKEQRKKSKEKEKHEKLMKLLGFK